MSVDIQRFEQADDDPALQYRAMSRTAVASLVAGIASLSAPLAWICVAFPVLGLLLGLYAWRAIRSRPDELAGLPVAKAGPSFQAAMSKGKFQGIICPTTPTGSRTVNAWKTAPGA